MRKLKVVLTVVCSLVAALAMGLWAITHPRHRDGFEFLKGHNVKDSVVWGPGSWGPGEARMYSWHQPCSEVIQTAGLELERVGFKRRKIGKDADNPATWETKLYNGGLCGYHAEWSIQIWPGNNSNHRDFFKHGDTNPGWTTVDIGNDLDDDWVTVLRYTCFGFRP